MQVFDNSFFFFFVFSETEKAKNQNGFQHVGGMMMVFSRPTKIWAGVGGERWEEKPSS